MSNIFTARHSGRTHQPWPFRIAVRASILIISQWRDSKHNERNIAWAKETYDRLAPCSRDGAYSNYMDDDESMARVRQAFGDNFPRLQKLKDRYDPTNIFHRNQNIPPS